MKRGNGLQRRTGLARGPLQLSRKTPLARTVMRREPAQQTRQRPNSNDWPQDTRDAVSSRSRGRCEIALKGTCTGPATDMHHRQARRTRRHTPANALHACRDCHAWVTREPAASRGLGWIVSVYSRPESTPVLVRGRWVLLSDDGRYLEATP